ncbi:hypothetical protein GJAV_G00174450 [Gymnothorax javanicus]|nr:hypothetical protein GJAV_G00174450 [Gymnothorax javanicus]
MDMKRLYIGGLGHTISQKDLKDRFGKFGEVSDVEIITRKDETGIPVKTFGYININISDEALRKCMTVLNKSTWKGGTLQIEMAKESFLNRLAVERQQATEKAQCTNTPQKDKLVESFKKAGVENFHMKAAVPGTEIPGHKDWVVSKFGRVLPVLHLKSQGKNKISFSNHNIKKLENTADVPTLTPVSQLTWEILEGDDDISKKRRGEFPSQIVRPNKMKKGLLCKVNENSHPLVQYSNSKEHQKSSVNNQSNSLKVGHNASTHLTQNVLRQNHAVLEKGNPALKGKTKSVYVFDSEADSDEEIQMLVAQENARIKDVDTGDDEDNLEVVSDDFSVKPSMFWTGKNSVGGLAGGIFEETIDEREYDSADTDEILTQRKAPAISLKQGETDFAHLIPSRTMLDKCDSSACTRKRKKTPGTEVLPKLLSCVSESRKGGSEECLSSGSDSESDYEAMVASHHRIELSLADLEQLAKEASMSEEEEDMQTSGSQAASGPWTKNVPFSRGEVSAAPLPKKGNTPEEILAAILEDSSDEENDNRKKKKRRKTGQTPSLPAFSGTRALLATFPRSQVGLSPKRNRDEEKQDTAEAETKPKLERPSQSSEPSSLKYEHEIGDCEILPLKGSPPISLQSNEKVKPKDHSSSLMESSESESTDSHSDSSCSDMEEGEDSSRQPFEAASDTNKSTPKHAVTMDSVKASSTISGSQSIMSGTTDQLGAKEKVWMVSTPIEQFEDNTALLGSRKPAQKKLDSKSIQEKQKQDNQKRLAALEQKQKEAELQKKLIQGALSMLDAPVSSKGKHIVFDSDESEDEAEQSLVEPPKHTHSLFDESSQSTDDSSTLDPMNGAKQGHCIKVSQGSEKQTGSKLFESSEEDEGTEDEDEARFQIKPQFEGKSGQKLMQLQSRFGTDERFRLDSRFLESDDDSDIPDASPSRAEEEVQLEEEKKKNLDILQSLLNTNVQSAKTHKEAAKNKQFRDISALHYDPTREEHAAFEKETEEPKKESKAARRKKREEAEKLPEVSKEIYYDVAVDLKAAFGSQKEKVETKPAIAWDEEEEEEGMKETEVEEVAMQATVADSSVLNTGTKNTESTGFQFSFFGNDSTNDTTVKDDYKIEILKGAKLRWQENPCLRDSSSEEEEEEMDEGGGDLSACAKATEEPVAAKKRFFFFFSDDERLKEGPKIFCRSTKLEDQRENWEEKRTTLIEEYRKKHKDARRRLKASQKS